jgi:hypothetical protein
VVKYFRFTYEYILWEISFANLNMLLATIPSYKFGKNEKKDEVEGLSSLDELWG